MKKICLGLVFSMLLSLLTTAIYAQGEVCYNPNLVKDTTKKSIRSMAVGLSGNDTVIRISYHSPGVRKRVIWGGLVPYGEVWVTGAHNATTLEFSRPVRIAGTVLAPGKYAFFTIPGKKHWTLIINKHWDQHLASEYSEQDDLLRVVVKPRKNPHTERLQYFVSGLQAKQPKITVAWEKLKVELPFFFD